MIRKPRHVVSNGQSLVDVAIQRYGSAEGLFLLLAENEDLTTASILTPGQELVYNPDDWFDVPVAKLLNERSYIVNCGQANLACGNITSDMFEVVWNTTWNGTRYIVNSATFLMSGIVLNALFTEDMIIYNSSGLQVGSSSPGPFPNENPHVDFYTSDPAYGTIGVADFGFLPGTYQHTLSFDQVTLIDGTVCSGNAVFVLEFESTWPSVPVASPGFDYVLPITFNQ